MLRFMNPKLWTSNSNKTNLIIILNKDMQFNNIFYRIVFS